VLLHQYLDTGTYTIRIREQFPRFRGSWFYIGVYSDNYKLIANNQWGTGVWQNMFTNCGEMEYMAVDKPNLTGVNNLRSLFDGCYKFNGNINDWDMSNIIDITSMFRSCLIYNQAVNNWDVSRVKYFGCAFVYTAFNQPVNNWQVDSALALGCLFASSQFNQPLSNWNTGNVTSWDAMFRDSHFNQPIGNWDVSGAITMDRMFENTPFNQPIDNWVVDSVTSMAWMFQNSSFNQSINSWNTGQVTTIREMFKGSDFNRDIGSWNTSNVQNFGAMFKDDSTFNQDISNWVISTRALAYEFLDNTNMSTNNYDSLLIKWSQQGNFVVLVGAKGLSYCAGDSARAVLISRAWTFVGDTLNCLGVGVENVALEEQTPFNVYPNPTNALLYVEMPSVEAVQQELIMYNVQGQLVFSKTISQNKEAIDVSSFKSGIYLLRIGEKSKRVVVQ
jgi:surface protein